MIGNRGYGLFADITFDLLKLPGGTLEIAGAYTSRTFEDERLSVIDGADTDHFPTLPTNLINNHVQWLVFDRRLHFTIDVIFGRTVIFAGIERKIFPSVHLDLSLAVN